MKGVRPLLLIVCSVLPARILNYKQKLWAFFCSFNVFELPLAVFSFTKNHYLLVILNTKDIYKYQSFLIYCNAERVTFKNNFMAVNKILFQNIYM